MGWVTFILFGVLLTIVVLMVTGKLVPSSTVKAINEMNEEQARLALEEQIDRERFKPTDDFIEWMDAQLKPYLPKPTPPIYTAKTATHETHSFLERFGVNEHRVHSPSKLVKEISEYKKEIRVAEAERERAHADLTELTEKYRRNQEKIEKLYSKTKKALGHD